MLLSCAADPNPGQNANFFCHTQKADTIFAIEYIGKCEKEFEHILGC
jgi:hypothetical protein